MALDGAYLSLLAREIREKVGEARIDKISQPARDTLVIALRWRGGGGKLLLNAGAAAARVHFVTETPENPKAAPMFCMLMRKHLGSGRLVGVEQVGMDRILHLKFETVNELGDTVVLTLAIEIMGRHSNLMLIGHDGRVIDAIKRVDQSTSSVRPILPGVAYTLPPQQHKLSPLEHSAEELCTAVTGGRNAELSKGILEQVEGLSPVVCRELAGYALRGSTNTAGQLNKEQTTRLTAAFAALKNHLEDPAPTLVLDEGGRPIEFSYLPLEQYGNLRRRSYEGEHACSDLLCDFFREKDRVERTRQRSGDLLRLLVNATDRVARRLDTQRQELAQSQERDTLRKYGDLLSANLYTLQKGDSKAVVQDFYDPEGAMVEIPLDMRLTPTQNAQHYYSEYRKADTAEKKLRVLIEKGEEELEYLDSVFDALTRASMESELTAIRAELAQQGYVRANSQRGQKPAKLQPMRYRSSDGFLILCGRNNLQNDQLTLKDSRNYDLWFHTQKIPGSHTVVVAEGKEIPNRTMEEAAIIAAYNSKARASSKVPVDYVLIKYVKKPQGAKPGMVIYDNYKTAIVTPDEDLVRALAEK
ncbi:MAG: NFACT family protein [Oscillospiraceae bacterium]|nr:NFACT family protein [Oscillospiraceae bacterium]